MAKSHYIDRPLFSLKDAETRLVEACGGAVEAAEFCRVSSSQLHRYTDPSRDDCHMPADVVMVLERIAGEPIVTQFLAAKAGWDMTPRESQESDEIEALAGALGFEMAELNAEVFRATADKVIDEDEARRIGKEAADVERKAALIVARASSIVDKAKRPQPQTHPSTNQPDPDKPASLKAVS